VPGDLAAVAFAKVKTGEMKFIGWAHANDLVPNVKPYRDWPALLAQWKKDAEALGAAFAAGDARVDPKDALKTCRLCDLQTLCRVYESFRRCAAKRAAGEPKRQLLRTRPDCWVREWASRPRAGLRDGIRWLLEFRAGLFDGVADSHTAGEIGHVNPCSVSPVQ
jgi:hypothetical protein